MNLPVMASVAAAAAIAALLAVPVGSHKEEPQPEMPMAVKGDRLPLATPEVEPAVEVPIEVSPPKAVATERIEPPVTAPAVPPKPPIDSVCGPRGRTWYTKDNGWRYWRCNR
jgi:hypothetical protein